MAVTTSVVAAGDENKHLPSHRDSPVAFRRRGWMVLLVLPLAYYYSVASKKFTTASSSSSSSWFQLRTTTKEEREQLSARDTAAAVVVANDTATPTISTTINASAPSAMLLQSKNNNNNNTSPNITSNTNSNVTTANHGNSTTPPPLATNIPENQSKDLPTNYTNTTNSNKPPPPPPTTTTLPPLSPASTLPLPPSSSLQSAANYSHNIPDFVNVVLVGDWHVFLQYLLLRDFLRTGEWLPCPHFNNSDKTTFSSSSSTTPLLAPESTAAYLRDQRACWTEPPPKGPQPPWWTLIRPNLRDHESGTLLEVCDDDHNDPSQWLGRPFWRGNCYFRDPRHRSALTYIATTTTTHQHTLSSSLSSRLAIQLSDPAALDPYSVSDWLVRVANDNTTTTTTTNWTHLVTQHLCWIRPRPQYVLFTANALDQSSSETTPPLQQQQQPQQVQAIHKLLKQHSMVPVYQFLPHHQPTMDKNDTTTTNTTMSLKNELDNCREVHLCLDAPRKRFAPLLYIPRNSSDSTDDHNSDNSEIAHPSYFLPLVYQVWNQELLQLLLDVKVSIPQTRPWSSAVTTKNSKVDNNTAAQTPTRDPATNHLHVAFVGDSVTRYQFLSFLYHVHHQRWPRTSDKPSVIKESGGNWQRFLQYSNGGLGGYEICDCFRGPNSNAAKLGPDAYFARSYENRYYRDHVHDNAVVFVQKFGHMLTIGHYAPHDIDQTQQQQVEHQTANNNNNSTTANTNTNSSSTFVPVPNFPVPYGYASPMWRYNWTELIHHHVSQLIPRPRYVYLNAGIWPNNMDRELIRAIREALDAHGMVGIFKRTTVQRDSTESPTVNVDEEIYCHGLHVCFSLAHRPYGYDHYTDSCHPDAEVYRRFNQALVQLMEHLDAGIILPNPSSVLTEDKT